MRIKRFSMFLALMVSSLVSCAQPASSKRIGGGCEGCEAIYESIVPFDQLPSSVQLPDFNDAGPKIEISGIVYHRDGKTPAKDVVLYVYHTDQTGAYPTKGNEKGWAKQHGYIRGWVKTDKNGFYQFYTLRPQPYPGRKDPAHIHITVKEPDKNEYWIDDFLFEDDPLLKDAAIHSNPRGGDGVVKLIPQQNNIAHATRHVILGLNVPDYPYTGLPKLSSGLEVGANCPAFDPLHVSGPDKGKKACPMCKYGYGQGVMVWFNHSNLDHMKEFLLGLESEMRSKGEKKIRVFFIYMNPFYKENPTDVETGIITRKLREWCEQQKMEKVAMTWIPSPVDEETAGLYKINPEAKNTVFIYRKRTVTAKWVNVEYDEKSLKEILQTL